MSFSSGLASLTAQYTDSEGEDEQKDSDSPSPEKVQEIKHSPHPTKMQAKRIARLVSYHDDADADADDDGVIDAEIPEIVNNSKVIIPEPEPQEKPKEDVVMVVEEPEVIEEDENDVKLPPEPNGKCSAELQDKITHLYQRMKSSAGFDMNEIIQKRKTFRNPSIYEKLVQFCGINELGTNYPPNIYDPELWGKESFYEELGRVQKAEMDKREKERKEKTKVEFVSGTAKRITLSIEDDKKRKSKWDQVGGLSSAAISAPSLLRSAGLTQPPISTSSSGTKGTVISAFGSLPKKPRI